MHSGQRRQAGSCASASSTVRRLAAVISSSGTHSGNGISVVRWAPDAVCSSSTAAKRLPGKRSATRTRAGHSRRWMRVIFPLTRRVAITSGELSTQVSTAKISWPDPCPHQLPRIGSPATCSARLGTGPRADCNTTPCSRTHSSGSTIVDSNTRAPRPPSARSPRPLSLTAYRAGSHPALILRQGGPETSYARHQRSRSPTSWQAVRSARLIRLHRPTLCAHKAPAPRSASWARAAFAGRRPDDQALPLPERSL